MERILGLKFHANNRTDKHMTQDVMILHGNNIGDDICHPHGHRCYHVTPVVPNVIPMVSSVIQRSSMVPDVIFMVPHVNSGHLHGA